MMKFLVAIILTFITLTSFAQELTRKEKKAARRGESISEPTSLDPGNSGDESTFSPKTSPRKVKKSNGPTHNAEKEFQGRMDAKAKTNRYNEKMLMKPQYSDPSYFGHKHKPRRHSAKNMKFCKECGIRH
ncbi:MAG: hypothetical protein ABI477_02350 [Chryseolinea sp.]